MDFLGSFRTILYAIGAIILVLTLLMPKLMLPLLMILAVATLINAIIMYGCAKIANIDSSTFELSFKVSLGVAFVTFFTSILFSLIPTVGSIIGFLIGAGISILIIKTMFDTSYDRAIVVWVLPSITGLLILLFLVA